MTTTHDPGHGFVVAMADDTRHRFPGESRHRRCVGVDTGGRLHLSFDCAGPMSLTPAEALELAEAITTWVNSAAATNPDGVNYLRAHDRKNDMPTLFDLEEAS